MTTNQSDIVRKLNNLARARERVARAEYQMREILSELPQGRAILTNLVRNQSLVSRLETEIRTETVQIGSTVRGQSLTAAYYAAGYSYDKTIMDNVCRQYQETYPDVVESIKLARKTRKAYSQIR